MSHSGMGPAHSECERAFPNGVCIRKFTRLRLFGGCRAGSRRVAPRSRQARAEPAGGEAGEACFRVIVARVIPVKIERGNPLDSPDSQ
jgi:hypothetical protein